MHERRAGHQQHGRLSGDAALRIVRTTAETVCTTDGRRNRKSARRSRGRAGLLDACSGNTADVPFRLCTAWTGVTPVMQLLQSPMGVTASRLLATRRVDTWQSTHSVRGGKSTYIIIRVHQWRLVSTTGERWSYLLETRTTASSGCQDENPG